MTTAAPEPAPTMPIKAVLGQTLGHAARIDRPVAKLVGIWAVWLVAAYMFLAATALSPATPTVSALTEQAGAGRLSAAGLLALAAHFAVSLIVWWTIVFSLIRHYARRLAPAVVGPWGLGSFVRYSLRELVRGLAFGATVAGLVVLFGLPGFGVIATQQVVVGGILVGVGVVAAFLVAMTVFLRLTPWVVWAALGIAGPVPGLPRQRGVRRRLLIAYALIFGAIVAIALFIGFGIGVGFGVGSAAAGAQSWLVAGFRDFLSSNLGTLIGALVTAAFQVVVLRQLALLPGMESRESAGAGADGAAGPAADAPAPESAS